MYHPDVLGRKHGGDEEDSAAKKKTKTSEDRSGAAEMSTGRTDKKSQSGVRSQGTHDEESQDQLKVKDNAVVPDREVATTATQTMEEESKQEAIVPMVSVVGRYKTRAHKAEARLAGRQKATPTRGSNYGSHHCRSAGSHSWNREKGCFGGAPAFPGGMVCAIAHVHAILRTNHAPFSCAKSPFNAKTR